MNPSWREQAAPVVRATLEQFAADEEPDHRALRTAVRDAYPFGERRYWPYQVWLHEVRVQKHRRWPRFFEPAPREARKRSGGHSKPSGERPLSLPGKLLGTHWMDHQTGLCASRLDDGRFLLWWVRDQAWAGLELVAKAWLDLGEAAELADALSFPDVKAWILRMAERRVQAA